MSSFPFLFFLFFFVMPSRKPSIGRLSQEQKKFKRWYWKKQDLDQETSAKEPGLITSDDGLCIYTYIYIRIYTFISE